MARFEVFIPAADPAAGMSLTLRVTADTWMAALKIGLKKIGETSGMPQNVLCDIHDDESIHVTDSRSNRVFRILEIPEVSNPGVELPRPSSPPPAGAAATEPELPNIAAAVAAREAQERKEKAEAEARQREEKAAAEKARLERERAEREKAEQARVARERAELEKAEKAARTKAEKEKLEREREKVERERLAREKAEKDRLEKERLAAEEQAAREASERAQAAAREKQERETAEKDKARKLAASQGKGEPFVVQVPAPKKTPPKVIGREAPTAADGLTVEDTLVELFDRTPAVFEKKREDALYFLLDLAMEKIPSDSGSVYVADLNRRDLRFAAARGPKADELLKLKLSVPMGRGFVGFCAQEGVGVAISDVQRDPRFYKDISERLGYETKSILTTPIIASGRTLGAIQLVNKKGSSSFSPAELSILHYVAHQAATYLESLDA